MGQIKQEDNVEEKCGQVVELGTEPIKPVVTTAKRIAAAIGVFLLLTLIAATFIVACIDFDGKERVFSALLLCDIVIPVFLWFILRFLS